MKGRLILSPVNPKNLHFYEKSMVMRQTGLVKISRVWYGSAQQTVKVDYYFQDDPKTVLSSQFLQGFYVVLAYLPKAEEEEDMWLEVKQSELVHCLPLLTKKDAQRYETDFESQIRNVKNNFNLYVDTNDFPKTVALAKRRPV